MKKQWIAFVAISLFSCLSQAKVAATGGGGGSHGDGHLGGLGYLFTDPNSLKNPGQTALVHKMHVEIGYEKIDGTQDQTVVPSLAWGNGKIGFNVFALRNTTDFSNKDLNSDTIGAMLGGAFASGRLSAGLKAYRSISVGQMNDGHVEAAINLNGTKRVGFSLGVNGGTTLNNAGGEVRYGGASLGWGFNNFYSLEAHYQINDFSMTSNYVASAFATAGGKHYYFSAGGNHYSSTSFNELEARLGLHWGAFDFSVLGSKLFADNSPYHYGGTLRLNF